MEIIQIAPPFIKLEQFLKFSGAVETGGQAKTIIQSGIVLVNEEICTMRGKKLREGDIVSFSDNDIQLKCEFCNVD